MSTTTLEAPTTRRVLERATAALAARRRAEVEVLDSVLAWAHAHVVTTQGEAAGWRSEAIPTPGTYAAAMFGEKAVPIAGPGAPLVAEFCVYELAAALDLSHDATLALLGDVLDLAHRLPRLWALVRSQRVPVHLGREAARVSRDLTVEAAGHADRLLVWQPRRLNPHRVGVLVHEARLYADPDRAIADHDAALETRKVEVRYDRGAPGTGEVFMVLDEADTIAFDHTVSTMAATIGTLGHPGASTSVVPTRSGSSPTRRRRSTYWQPQTSRTPTDQSTRTTTLRCASPRTSPTNEPTRSAGPRRGLVVRWCWSSTSPTATSSTTPATVLASRTHRSSARSWSDGSGRGS